MKKADVETSSAWAAAVRQRRKALLQRLGMGAASAMVFSPIIGWTFGAVWVAGYFLIQLLDLWAFAPIYSGRTDRMGRLRTLAGGVMLVSNAGYFGSLSIALWAVGGANGGVCAALLLSAGAIYSVINAPRSTTVLFLTASMQFVYLAATPVLMATHGSSPPMVVAATIAVCVYIAYCLSTWQRMEDARRAEQSARIEAQRRSVEVERIMEGRSAFLATIGHDLRTPISAILTGAAELERGAADSTARSQAALISDAGLMMKALLDDLLDHAKLESGRMTVDTADFNLRSLIAQTVRLWQAPARAKGLKLRVEGAATLPAMVRGDPIRLRQVLNNLISNAMKFTDAGSITLTLSAWEDEPGGHAVVIDIADTGPGMTAEQMSRLFTPFDQTADGVSARHGGTGLGLAISRQVVELMGGRLTARSAPGCGANFTFSILLGASTADVSTAPAMDREGRDIAARAFVRPTAASSPTALPEPQVPALAQPESAADITPSGDSGTDEALDNDERPLRVLVVDDHDINRRAIQLILNPLGCEVTTAVDGMAALKACEAEAFDIIFMDVRMPELDGRETTRRLRAGAGPNALAPVIAVTADTAPEDIAACEAAGMTYFVPKPITPQMLLGAVSHVLATPSEDLGESQTVAA
ncbi:response regulator [Rhizobium sp. CRIBSB]|nr:response regulator [Rhizobium sp. CRIBSB]